jgi:hypothetical protein
MERKKAESIQYLHPLSLDVAGNVLRDAASIAANAAPAPALAGSTTQVLSSAGNWQYNFVVES